MCIRDRQALFFLPFYIIDGGFFHYAGDFNSQQISFYRYMNGFIKGAGYPDLSLIHICGVGGNEFHIVLGALSVIGAAILLVGAGTQHHTGPEGRSQKQVDEAGALSLIHISAGASWSRLWQIQNGLSP